MFDSTNRQTYEMLKKAAEKQFSDASGPINFLHRPILLLPAVYPYDMSSNNGTTVGAIQVGDVEATKFAGELGCE